LLDESEPEESVVELVSPPHESLESESLEVSPPQPSEPVPPAAPAPTPAAAPTPLAPAP
jgi:hypothetical protein